MKSNSRQVFQAILNEGIKKGTLDNQLKSLAVAYNEKKVEFIDHEYYSVKSVSETTVSKFFEAADKPDIGITNLDGARLPANSYMLVWGVRMLAEVAGGTTADDLKACDFESLGASAHKNVINGEIDLKLNRSKTVFEQQSLRMFKNDNAGVQESLGLVVLDNPKIWLPDAEINAEIDLPLATTANTAIYFSVVGTLATPMA